MIQERFIEYEHEGVTLEGFLACDDAEQGERPAVMVVHAWGGRSQFECDKARALAELGYVGFAADLYGKGVLGASVEENASLIQPFLDDRAKLQSRLTTALATLSSQPEVDESQVAAIGYCFGGLCVLDLARIGTDIKGVASFHGLFGAPGNTAGTRITAKVLALHGHEDPMVPVDAVVALEQELTQAGADWQIHVYGNTLHAFTNPDANNPDLGAIYNKRAEQRSWQTLLNFLEELF
ncbi:MAG: dienelactone hydrolase family protein [Gammaproteobacteria bacterium]|nr:dienelactone hydrolase family protein [Gammaproteobacteria bacterium]MCY4338060.1 dienelactone hydrolase family protein [Gammaproteobacteria bacterium]